MIILDKVLKSACVFIVAHASISYIGLPNATLVWRSHGQETASARPGRDGFGRQEVERDEEGRVKRIINYDTQGNVRHRHVYNYAPRDGSFEIINCGVDGTVERTLHRGGA